MKMIAKRVKEIGGEALVVGGFVRDMAMGVEPKDVDFEVFGVEPDALVKVLAEFGEVTECGKAFGVFKVGEFDVAIPRTERKTGEGHKGFDVTPNPFLPKRDAAMRRDLTMNAMFLDPITGEVIDLFGGMKDIADKVIRHVNDATFAEDPLRVLRVAQFAARFDFTVAPETRELCRTLVPELATLPKERVFVEFEKALLKGKRPSVAFRFLAEIGALAVLMPELDALRGVRQGVRFHPEGDAFEHTMLAVDAVPMADRTIEIMLAVMLHDIGKAVTATVDGDDVHFHMHGHVGAKMAVTALARITDEVVLTDGVVKLIDNHMRPFNISHKITDRAVRRLIVAVDIEKLMVVHRADIGGRADGTRDTAHIDAIMAVVDRVKDSTVPLLMGRHLIEMGMTPGPRFGEIITAAFDAQLDGKFNTVEGAIEFARRLA